MHADVGGGYTPVEQGKVSQLSQIPLNHMLFMASKYGVPFFPINEIMAEGSLYKEDFFIQQPLIDFYVNYNLYANSTASLDGTLPDLIKAYTKQYIQWRSDLLVSGLEKMDFYNRAGDAQYDLKGAQDDLIEQVIYLNRLKNCDDSVEYDIMIMGNIGKIERSL